MSQPSPCSARPEAPSRNSDVSCWLVISIRHSSSSGGLAMMVAAGSVAVVAAPACPTDSNPVYLGCSSPVRVAH
eukprot:12854028-Alexandrium_andersonii.AAC.1